MKTLQRYILLLVLVVAASCVRRPLSDPSELAKIEVNIITDGVSNVTKDIYNDKVPRPSLATETVRVVFYDGSGTRRLSEGFITEKRIDDNGNQTLVGDVMLSPGDYRILAYNFDTSSTLVEDVERYHTAKGYTSEISESLRARLRGTRADTGHTIYYEPDHLLVGRAPQYNLEAHHGVHTIIIDATTVVDTYYVQIRVKNLEYVSTATAVLTGLSADNLIGDNIRGEESSGVFIELHKSTDERIEDENKDVICAVFNTFGKIDSAHSDMFITFNAVTRDGEVIEKQIDMTSVFKSEDAQLRHWLIIDEIWEIPEPTTPPSQTGGGFDPNIDDWEGVEETIPIG